MNRNQTLNVKSQESWVISNSTVGIIGGMGPEATMDLMGKILLASKELDKPPRLVVDCNPTVPSRLAAIEGRGPSPVPVLQKMSKGLVQLGANILLIACNAAHYFYEEIRETTGGIPILNMIEEVVTSLLERDASGPIVVMGAAQIIEELYGTRLRAAGFTVILPETDDRRELNTILVRAWKGDLGQDVKRSAHELVDKMNHRGCTHLILACTELALLLQEYNGSLKLVDPLWILAQSTVKALKERLKGG